MVNFKQHSNDVTESTVGCCVGQRNTCAWRTLLGDSGVRICLNVSGALSEKIILVMETGLFYRSYYCVSAFL